MPNMQDQSKQGIRERSAAETRELYRQKYEAQLREWNAKVDELRAHQSKLGAQARLDMQPQIESVRNRYETARTRFQDLGNAAEDTWDDVKRNAEDAWNDFKSSIEGAYDAIKSYAKSSDRQN